MRLNKKELRKEFEIELTGDDVLRPSNRKRKQMEKELEEYYKEA